MRRDVCRIVLLFLLSACGPTHPEDCPDLVDFNLTKNGVPWPDWLTSCPGASVDLSINDQPAISIDECHAQALDLSQWSGQTVHIHATIIERNAVIATVDEMVKIDPPGETGDFQCGSNSITIDFH
jgi:hypothetical protein